MEPHVKILREFRDRFLLSNRVGKGFVNLYYRYSPPMAAYTARHDALRAVVRLGLFPIVGMSWMALLSGSVVSLTLLISIVLLSILVFAKYDTVRNNGD